MMYDQTHPEEIILTHAGAPRCARLWKALNTCRRKTWQTKGRGIPVDTIANVNCETTEFSITADLYKRSACDKV